MGGNNKGGTWGRNSQLDKQQQQYGSRANLSSSTNLAHWSSHGYLAKPPDPNASATQLPPANRGATLDNRDSGYVLLKRQGDQMVTVKSQTLGPQSLPSAGGHRPPPMLPNDQQACLDTSLSGEGGRKYFSVRGFSDMRTKHNIGGGGGSQPQNGMVGQGQNPMGQANGDIPQVTNGDINKYYSVDARYNSIKNLPQDLRMKLRQQVQQPQQQQQQQQQQQPVPPPRLSLEQQQQPAVKQVQGAAAPAQGLQTRQQHEQSSLEKSKQMSGSVSWLEWTQQLQAYIAWVNSQLRKRPDLKQVQDLRTDLQSGEVLAQLIEIICKLLKNNSRNQKNQDINFIFF